MANREPLLNRTPLASIRVTAIITGIRRPVVMMTDARGIGYSLVRGDYFGKPDVVNMDGQELLLNWRIHSIRSDCVVLEREAGTNEPPLRRVVAVGALASSNGE